AGRHGCAFRVGAAHAVPGLGHPTSSLTGWPYGRVSSRPFQFPRAVREWSGVHKDAPRRRAAPTDQRQLPQDEPGVFTGRRPNRVWDPRVAVYVGYVDRPGAWWRAAAVAAKCFRTALDGSTSTAVLGGQEESPHG